MQIYKYMLDFKHRVLFWHPIIIHSVATYRISKGVHREEGMRLQFKGNSIFIPMSIFSIYRNTSPTRLTFEPGSNWPGRSRSIMVIMACTACSTTKKPSSAPTLPAKAEGLKKPKIKVLTQQSLALVWQANASRQDL